MRTFKLFVCLAFACLAVWGFSLSASAATDCPYGIYVGNVPVTPENASDILGDGTASYDIEEDLLRLDGFDSPLCSEVTTTGKGRLYFSVYCNGTTTVEITGEGNRFQDAVYTKGGNIILHDASVTFPGTGFIFLLAEGGDILLKDSTVTISSVGNLDTRGFSGENVVLQNAKVSLLTDTPSSGLEALFYATKTLSVSRGSEVTVRTTYPLFNYVFWATDLSFTDATLSLDGCNYVFYAPSGALNLSSVEMDVTNTCLLSVSASLYIQEQTRIEAELFYSGIRVRQPDDWTELVIENSAVHLTRLPFADMIPLVRALWSSMDEEDRPGGSFESFCDSYREQFYDTASDIGYGLCYYSGDFLLRQAELTLHGFAYGIYGQYGVTLSVENRCRLDLKAGKGALLLFLDGPDSVSMANRHRISRAKVQYYATPESMAQAGEFIYGAAVDRLSVSENAGGTERELLSSVRGLSTELLIRTGPYMKTWVVLTLVGSISAVALAVGTILIVRETKRRSR